MKRFALPLAVSLAILVLFTVVATQLLLRLNHIVDDFAFPYYQWWGYLYLHLFIYRHTGLSIWLQLLVTGLLGALGPVLFVRAWLIRRSRLIGPRLNSRGLPRDPIPSNSRAHGDADSMSLDQARKIFR